MSKQIMMVVPAPLKDQLDFVNGTIREVEAETYATNTDVQCDSEAEFIEIQRQTVYILRSIRATLEACSRKQSFWDKLKSLFR